MDQTERACPDKDFAMKLALKSETEFELFREMWGRIPTSRQARRLPTPKQLVQGSFHSAALIMLSMTSAMVTRPDSHSRIERTSGVFLTVNPKDVPDQIEASDLTFGR